MTHELAAIALAQLPPKHRSEPCPCGLDHATVATWQVNLPWREPSFVHKRYASDLVFVLPPVHARSLIQVRS